MAHDFAQPVTTAAPAPFGGPAAGKLQVAPRPNFLLMHHPTAWECVKRGDRYEWLPRLKKLKNASGCNGVRQTKNGPDPSLALARFQSQGWVILFDPEKVLPAGRLGNDKAGYVQVDKGAGGAVHRLWCESFRMIGKKVIEECDDNAYYDFRRMLVEDGLVPEPDRAILDGIIDMQANRWGRHANNAHIPAIKAKMEAAQAKLEGMKDATATTAAERKPRAKRPRKSRDDG